jgi:hypothetical protein
MFSSGSNAHLLLASRRDPPRRIKHRRGILRQMLVGSREHRCIRVTEQDTHRNLIKSLKGVSREGMAEMIGAEALPQFLFLPPEPVADCVLAPIANLGCLNHFEIKGADKPKGTSRLDGQREG